MLRDMIASRSLHLLDVPSRIARGLTGLGRRFRSLSVGFVNDWTLGIWMISWNGDLQGTLRHDGARWCLDWLESADPRLACFAGPRPGASFDDIAADLHRHLAAARPPASAPAASLRIEAVPVF